MKININKFYKAAIIFSFIIFIVSQTIFGQIYIPKDINPNIHFGKNNFGYIVVDENKISEEEEENFCYNYIKKHFNIKSQKDIYYFSALKSEFKPYTNYYPGDKFYIASASEIISSDVIGYAICRPIEVLRFYTVLSGESKITKHDDPDYKYEQVLLCSKNKINNTISYEKITENYLIKKLTREVLIKTEEIKTEEMRKEETYTEISVFKGNFMNSENQEYAVSFHKVTSIGLCISYLVIVDENGNILKEVSPLLNIGYHFICLGTSDYNSDGKDEIIAKEGYYEGGGYVLIEYNGFYFEIIAEGFYDGL